MHGRSFVAGVLTTVGVLLPLGYYRDQSQSAAVAAAKARADSAQAEVVVAKESVTVFVPILQASRAESDRLAEIVRVTGTMELTVQLTPNAAPEQVHVPAPVAALIQAQGRTIADLDEMNRRKDTVIVKLEASNAAKDTVIATLEAQRPPRCQAKCGGVIVLGGLTLLKLALSAL